MSDIERDANQAWMDRTQESGGFFRLPNNFFGNKRQSIDDALANQRIGFVDGYKAGVAQSVGSVPCKDEVAGSSPATGSSSEPKHCKICGEPLNVFGICKNGGQLDRHPMYMTGGLIIRDGYDPGNNHDYLRGFRDGVLETCK